MTLAMVARRPGQVQFIRPDLRLAQFGRVCLEAAPCYVDPAVVADESDALRKMIVARHAHNKTVGVEALKVVINRRVPQAVFGKQALAVNFRRAGVVAIHAPMRDVDMMGAPVGDLAAGIIQNPAEIPVTALLRVTRPGSGSEPHLVVKTLGNRHDRLRINLVKRLLDLGSLKSRTNADLDSSQCADAIVADQLAPKTEMIRRTLPAPGLPDALVVIDFLDNRPAFCNG